MKKLLLTLSLIAILFTITNAQKADQYILTVKEEYNYNTKIQLFEKVEPLQDKYTIEFYGLDSLGTVRIMYDYGKERMVFDAVIIYQTYKGYHTTIIAINAFGNNMRIDFDYNKFLISCDYRDFQYEGKDWMFTTLISGKFKIFKQE